MALLVATPRPVRHLVDGELGGDSPGPQHVPRARGVARRHRAHVEEHLGYQHDVRQAEQRGALQHSEAAGDVAVPPQRWEDPRRHHQARKGQHVGQEPHRRVLFISKYEG